VPICTGFLRSLLSVSCYLSLRSFHSTGQNDTGGRGKIAVERYLHFDNFDMGLPCFSSRCSRCGQEFTGELRPGELLEDVVNRIRQDFDRHECSVRRELTTR
jgi:hypothetical protein